MLWRTDLQCSDPADLAGRDWHQSYYLWWPLKSLRQADFATHFSVDRCCGAPICNVLTLQILLVGPGISLIICGGC